MRTSSDARNLLFGVAGISFLTVVFSVWTQGSSPTTVGLSFLVVVLLVAAAARLWAAVTTSVAAMLAFNFFFLPPVGTLTIADPQNWIALFAFLAVSLVASNLSAVARERAREAVARRDELGRLFDLSRDVLLITESHDANAKLAGFISHRFGLDYAAICVREKSGWAAFGAGSLEADLSDRELDAAFADLQDPAHPADAAALGDIERIVAVGRQRGRLVPLRLGTRPIGVLVVVGRSIESGTLETIAGVAAIAIERAQFLDERKNAELARQSEEVKSALLASFGHDLKTPLTAIRVAASNLQASWPDEQQRQEQSDLILAEVDRLTRLFQNVLEMARIDAGAVTQEMRWVAPTEIVEAARDRVEHALRGHVIEIAHGPERMVRLDPRLTAAALSHLLENAAHYSSAGTTIEIHTSVTNNSLTIAVRDHGPGISPADLPHVFERLYRGSDATTRSRAGTGMGLAIARGLLAAEHGQIFADSNLADGARFTIVVPAEVQ